MADGVFHLDGLRPTLGLFYRALSGRDAAFAAHPAEDDPARYPDMRGTIRLPARADPAWYRVALAHRATHYDAGTFDFALFRPATRFATLRPEGGSSGESDLARFLRLFAYPTLALDCFTLMEDARVDAILAKRYPGLRAAMAEARRSELARRPAVQSLAPRAALLELLARASLGWSGEAGVAAPLAEPARAVSTLGHAIADPEATVEDAAEAAIRAYALISRVPQLIAAGAVTVSLGPGDLPPDPAIALPETERARIEGDAILEVPLAPIAYRGSLEALVADRPTPGPLDQEAILRLRAIDGDAREGEGKAPSVPARARDVDDAQPSGPIPHEHHEYGDEEDAAHEQGALAADGPGAFVYPEWDHRARRYRERWCRVREVRAEGGATARAYRETLAEHAQLVREIRSQFERVAPETLRRVRGLRDGDELDLDAAIEAVADLRAGVLPSENVYAAREVAQRDLAAAFLVDLSASTAERIEEPAGRPARRILDVERESLVLLVEALERVGDVYGLYGFSGTGREDVRFVVIKDLRERVTDRVLGRLDTLRPIHTTRMGAAIRHATRKLAVEECATKLLVVISDGRPFDIDYGQQYGEGAEIDYAVHDTRRALDEARAAAVRPFLLTVDRQGADYLREMCRGIDYEVLARTRELPAHLLALYRRLAARPGDFAAAG